LSAEVSSPSGHTPEGSFALLSAGKRHKTGDSGDRPFPLTLRGKSEARPVSESQDRGFRGEVLTGNPVSWIISSNMTESADLNRQIAQRVRELRTAKSLSLEALAGRSGVSRSMISLIERAESSPTAVVLDKLAAALNVTLATLFGGRANGIEPGRRSPVARHADQPLWQDPDSGYRRRNVTPSGVSQPMQISEVHFPAGARVAFETGVREVPVHQQVWVLEGEIEVALGEDRHHLRKGDCLAMQLDGPTMFHNPTQKPARYAVVVACENHARKR